MPSYTTADIRNLALFGHGGCGKTTLVESLLHKAGAIHHLGMVEKGTTTSDATEEERHHGHSLFMSITHADYNTAEGSTHINLIDTPGYPDFIGQAFMAMPAIETAVLVINASAGIELNHRRIWERATYRKLCRMIVINKIDHDNIDLPQLVAQIQETFGKECLPINLPANGGTAVVDCFFNGGSDAGGVKPDFSSVEEAHQALVEQVVEVDEALMEKYLEQGDIEPGQLHEPFEEALREGHLVPICFTAARPHGDPEKAVGVQELLDVIVKLAPNPLEGNPRPFAKGGDTLHELHATPDPKKHVIAHVFSVTIDPFAGKLASFRLHQGTITKDTHLYIGDPKAGEAKKPFKVGHIFKLQGGRTVEVDAAIPGDICAVAKVEEVHRGAVLHDSHDEDHIRYLHKAYPEPMYGLAITAKRRGDEAKIGEALTKLLEEDPTLKVVRDSGTHEMVIYGMGELHLRIVLERMKNRFHVEVDTKQPKIAYRETVTAEAQGHHRHKKQTGGAGQFGEVYLRVKPLERGAGFEFVDDTFGGNPPKQFLPAIEKGVRMVLDGGAIAGYPIQDVRVEVYDGKHHDVDSKEVAFVTAGKRAFIDAVQKARPVILEPIAHIQITVPQQHVGTITGDLSGKRGRIQGTDMMGDQAIVAALVPLSEVANYQNQLKSVTGGQGSYTLDMAGYEPVPSHVQQQIAAQWKPHVEED
jgi:elongation factor G